MQNTLSTNQTYNIERCQLSSKMQKPNAAALETLLLFLSAKHSPSAASYRTFYRDIVLRFSTD